MNNNKDLSNSNLLKILKSFSKDEILEFEKFVSSPVYNSQGTLVRLYAELKKFYPEFSDIELSKDKLFDKVNPGKEYNDIIFRKYMSNLLKLAERYLIYLENQTKPERQSVNLLDQFDKRNLNGFYEKLLHQTEKTDKEKKIISNESFYNKHLLEEIKVIHNVRTSKLHLMKPDLKISHIYLLMNVLLSSTVYNNMMLVNRKSFKEAEDNNFFGNFFKAFDIINYLRIQDCLEKEEKWFVELCNYDNLLMNDPYDLVNLKKMHEYLISLIPHFNKNLLYTFFSHINIFYLLNISKGADDLKRKLLDNYKLMISRELYSDGERKFINFSEYKTILYSALRIKEFDWCEEFIEKFKNFHNPGSRDNIVIYSKACLKFETGDFESSMNFLSVLNADNVILQLDKNILHLLIYYELDYYDSALSLVDSFRHFIKDNKILSNEVIENHCNFIRYYKTILRLKQNSVNSLDFEYLRKEITFHDNIRRKEWLLEKLDELLNKNNVLKKVN